MTELEAHRGLAFTEKEIGLVHLGKQIRKRCPRNAFKNAELIFALQHFFAQIEQLIGQKAKCHDLGRYNQIWKTAFPLFGMVAGNRKLVSLLFIEKFTLTTKPPDFPDKHFLFLHTYLSRVSKYYVQSISSLLMIISLSVSLQFGTSSDNHSII